MKEIILFAAVVFGLVGLGLSYLTIKDMQDEKRRKADASKKDKDSRDLADEIFAIAPTGAERLSYSMVDKEAGLILLPDDYYPYDQSK